MISCLVCHRSGTMNMINFASVVSDSQGFLQFKFDTSKTDIYSQERRVSRRATLDGGSVVDDYGFSHSDRTFIVVAKVSGAKLDALNYLVRTFTSIMVSTIDGIFLGAFKDTRVKGNEVTIKILIKEKLA